MMSTKFAALALVACLASGVHVQDTDKEPKVPKKSKPAEKAASGKKMPDGCNKRGLMPCGSGFMGKPVSCHIDNGNTEICCAKINDEEVCPYGTQETPPTPEPTPQPTPAPTQDPVTAGKCSKRGLMPCGTGFMGKPNSCHIDGSEICCAKVEGGEDAECPGGTDEKQASKESSLSEERKSSHVDDKTSKKIASDWGGNDNKKEEKVPDGCNERFLLPCGWGFYGRGTACMSGDKHICCEGDQCPEAAKEDPEPEPTTPPPHEEPEIPEGVKCDAKPYKVDVQGKCHAKDGKYAKSECCADQKCYMLCKKMFGKCDFYPPLAYKGGDFDCSVCNECAP